jgi:trehalose 6-phosphate phosphatase
MAAAYLFSTEGLSALARFVRADTMFALDLDGTLAPHATEHTDSNINAQIIMTLQRLMNYVNVAVITAESQRDALAFLGFEPHLLIDKQSANWPAQKNDRHWQQVKHCLRWRDQLYESLCDFYGVEIEFKENSIAVHYEHAENEEETLLLINAAIEVLEPKPRKIDGKLVVNLFPGKAITRAEALLSAMEHFGAKRSVYFGDDEKEEEVFLLGRSRVFGVHVGQDEKTAAAHYLHSQSELPGLLNSILGILESP